MSVLSPSDASAHLVAQAAIAATRQAHLEWETWVKNFTWVDDIGKIWYKTPPWGSPNCLPPGWELLTRFRPTETAPHEVYVARFSGGWVMGPDAPNARNRPPFHSLPAPNLVANTLRSLTDMVFDLVHSVNDGISVLKQELWEVVATQLSLSEERAAAERMILALGGIPSLPDEMWVAEER